MGSSFLGAVLLTQRLGRAPTAAELADEVGVGRAEVVETMTAAAGFKARSIEHRFAGEDDSPALIDRLGLPDPGMALIDDSDALRVHLRALPEREYRIVVMRFFESLTQSEIAARMGISQMHVSRLLSQSLHRLREATGGSVDVQESAGRQAHRTPHTHATTIDVTPSRD